VLSDREKREQYDRLGKEAFGGQSPFTGGQNPFGGFDFSQFGNARGRAGARGQQRRGGGGFTDIFSDLFGGGMESEPQRGSDVDAETTIEFRDAILGTTLDLQMARPDGSRSAVKVKIPEGVRDGQKLRLRGKGSPGMLGGTPGDLNLTIHVRPHPFFERRGDDIYTDIPITVGEAIRGSDIDVPTVHGPVRARIPAGTQGGQTFRLTGKGVKRKNGGNGDHYYRVQIQVPRDLPPDALGAVETIESHYRENPRANLKTTV
jgi:molecular chaperone DnaJ